MRARSRAWSMDPNAFLKSMYIRYMLLVMNFAFSKAAMIV